MKIESDYALDALNTFGLHSSASHFCRIETAAELEELVQSALFLQQSVVWLGGGSNIILEPKLNSFVIQLCNKGMEVIEDNNDTVLVKTQAGEVWHEFVLQTLSLGYSGLENLSLIPGHVGAAPVQNIGAYGQEVSQSVTSVEVWDRKTKSTMELQKDALNFGYRTSLLKKSMYSFLFGFFYSA